MILRLCFATLLVFCLLGCANKTLSEQQRYQKLQQGLTYRAYTKASKETLNPLIKTYNQQRLMVDKSTVDESFTHALVGFVWSLSLQPDFALAEAQLSERKASNVRERYLACVTRSIAFYQKDWRQLASGESQLAKQLLAENNLTDNYDKKQAITHLIIGSLAVIEGDAEFARSSFAVVGDSIAKPWLPIVAQSSAYIFSNKWSESARLLKSLLQSGNLPEQEQQFVRALSAAADRQDVEIKGAVTGYLKRELLQSFRDRDDDFLSQIDLYMAKVKLK